MFKKPLSLLLALTSLFLTNCSDSQPGNDISMLSATTFHEKISATPDAIIIDVRTPGEFGKGHIENAINIDWRSGNFQNDIANIGKDKNIFLYCLSGTRSNAAAELMQSMGYKQIYELAGGLLKWNAVGFPLSSVNPSPQNKVIGMTLAELQNQLKVTQPVLVDFYAEWCGPCKQMAPSLEELKKEMAGKLVVIRIDVDANKMLTEQMQITDLPTLIIFRNGKESWSNIGYMSKEDIIKAIENTK